ncbi:MAG TPA: uroporphyrinogen-III synthase, partial [Microvirga sp.]|nr:uroporphyrinogen-III synthase [Microvirga sp.]
MLQGRRIAVPESRELDLFANMLERHGAIAVRCPLVSIHDVDDAAPVQAWLKRLAEGQHESLVLYTGEGLARLLGFARRGGIENEVIAGLRKTRKIVRGPKPAKVLRSLGLSPDMTAEEPTTAGLLATLARLALNGTCVGVQLYPGGEDLLTRFLEEAGAQADPILCYRYASNEEDERVAHLIDELISGDVDLIAFTSTAQVRRLQEVARQIGKASELDVAMQRASIAAVGPV